MTQLYNLQESRIITTSGRKIYDFTDSKVDENIDAAVVDSFGEEWTKFNNFSEKTLATVCQEYFDIIDSRMVNKDTYMIDIGCGTGRWSKYFTDKACFIEAVDPSSAILSADKLLVNCENVRLTKASVNTLPWPDETFDFGMSIGVLHHIPNTQLAMNDCVKKIKKNGWFYVYLYYSLDNRGFLFKTLFFLADIVRRLVCKLPTGIKKFVCDLIAVFVYMPFVLSSRFFKSLGLEKIGGAIPLGDYANKDFYIIRNDALDRFGTTLEQRFSKAEIEQMMRNAGLDNIIFGDKTPFWHAVGQRKN